MSGAGAAAQVRGPLGVLSHPLAAGVAVFAVGTALRGTRALRDTRDGELLWASLAVAGGVSLFRYGLPRAELRVTGDVAHEGAALRAVGDGITRVGDALDGVGDGVRDVGAWCAARRPVAATRAEGRKYFAQRAAVLRRPTLRRFARRPPRPVPPSQRVPQQLARCPRCGRAAHDGTACR